MLYKKNITKELEKTLFKNPTSEYRGAPFWAWNCKLDEKELMWQLDVLKNMGFGGAHMHVRTGMATPYLGEEYMKLIKACVQKSKNEDMYAWLYDEDRWPSGVAGGLVTKEEKNRCRYLLFTPFPYGTLQKLDVVKNTASAKGGRTEKGKLLACYDIELDEEGYLLNYRMISEDEEALYDKWYAYLEINEETPWFNNQTYVNTLSKEAIDKFIEITYEAYNRNISREFGITIPAIFTDEPQFVHKQTLNYATDKMDITLPWTDDLPITFAEAYQGENILNGLPELIWEKSDRQPSVLRYRYHDHVCERFTQAFVDNCGRWCREHGLKLTGHVMDEPTLESQTSALGEAMRCYRGFDLPGMDMLCGWFEYTTAKQVQSAVRQYGREGMTSELYGVTNWDFDFRGYKLHGDWQTAMGVTIRVPHLSWVSMAGEAKRDYPSSIHYQSPWHKKYSLIEDHYARLNTALTRGKPVVNIGVIHPIESYWLHWGPKQQTETARRNIDDDFQNLTQWLLFGGFDFDFICESLLPELCTDTNKRFKVGKMKYDIVLVPGCETLRSTTFEYLESFVESGGKLIFVGNVPRLENAFVSERGGKLAQKARRVEFRQGEILEALKAERIIEMRDQTGALTNNLLYQLREDGNGRWLFVAHGKEPYNKNISNYQDLRVQMKGKWKVTLYNTQNGEVEDIEQRVSGDVTEIRYRMYDYDSLLVRLEPLTNDKANKLSCKKEKDTKQIEIPISNQVEYTLSEPNALLLDQAEYALDGEEWSLKEEILRLDDICREKLGWPSRKVHVAQPWVTEEEVIKHTLHLRFEIEAKIEYKGAKLAIEDAERLVIKWNEEEISNVVTGWYVDKAIKTVNLPEIKIGKNVLEISVPFGKRTNIEWAYILGDFGVEIIGKNTCIVPLKETITFGDITRQGFPFYGGNITYHIPVRTTGGNLKICSNFYSGAMQEVSLDDNVDNPIIYPPYMTEFQLVLPGEHMLNITLYGHRGNGFGPVHLCDLKERWIGPKAWRSERDQWCYEYMLKEIGIITSPKIWEIKNKE